MDTKQEYDVENAAPFYFQLRQAVAKLRKAREALGMSQKDVAAKCGAAPETICRLETGAATNPSWQLLGGYAVAVGLHLELTLTEKRN